MKEGFLKTFDGSQIYFYQWVDVEKPKGIVQIFHGMAEHAKRYDDFAKFLNQNGFLVFADDHRAHGKTATDPKKLGTYDGTNLFYDILQDEIFISKMLKKDYNMPLYVFGHSFGSFLIQAYIEKCFVYDKAVLSGSALMKNRLDVKMGKIIAKITAKYKGKDAPAKLIEKMSFGKYIKQCKTGGWINSDKEEVKKYYADPFCGKPFSAKFYIDFFGAFDYIYKKELCLKIKKDKPIFLISGKEDPVGSMGKSVDKLFNFYKNLEIKDVKMKLYENARHEILNEPKIKQNVYKDVLKFLED